LAKLVDELRMALNDRVKIGGLSRSRLPSEFVKITDEECFAFVSRRIGTRLG
jgi:hypothetical protein